MKSHTRLDRVETLADAAAAHLLALLCVVVVDDLPSLPNESISILNLDTIEVFSATTATTTGRRAGLQLRSPPPCACGPFALAPLPAPQS